VLIGTVTMPDSIVHDLVRSVTGPTSTVVEPWVSDQNFRCHYYPALIVDEQTGERRSIWPQKWPLSYLESIEHTRDFKKNFQNDPLGRDGAYWTDTDFTYGTLPNVGSQLLSIDPAVTAKSTSDDTALAVIGCQREIRDREGRVLTPKQCAVLYAEARRVQVGAPLREWVIAVLTEFPHIRGVLIETNQGGDAWREILHDLGVPIEVVHNHVPKEVRAARLLARYQTNRVRHARRFPKAEGQMVGFPKSPYDDLVDAIGNGVAKYLGQPKVGETGPPCTLDYA
jgi:phage terminase large subunit-like protein